MFKFSYLSLVPTYFLLLVVQKKKNQKIFFSLSFIKFFDLFGFHLVQEVFTNHIPFPKF